MTITQPARPPFAVDESDGSESFPSTTSDTTDDVAPVGTTTLAQQQQQSATASAAAAASLGKTKVSQHSTAGVPVFSDSSMLRKYHSLVKLALWVFSDSALMLNSLSKEPLGMRNTAVYFFAQHPDNENCGIEALRDLFFGLVDEELEELNIKFMCNQHHHLLGPHRLHRIRRRVIQSPQNRQ